MAEEKTIGNFISFLNGKIGEAELEIVSSELKSKLEEIDFDSNPVKKGDSRKDWVKIAQDLFVNLGYMDKMDEKNYGSFGDRTLAAVKKYQKEKKLTETGEINRDLMNIIVEDRRKKAITPIYGSETKEE